MIARTILSVVAVGVLAASCGGGDDAAPDTDAPGTSADATPDTDAPVGTDIAPDARAPDTDAPGTSADTAPDVDAPGTSADTAGEGAATGGSVPGDEAEIAVGDWEPFDSGEDCRCADGSEVDYLQRIADPEKVVLYFEGGGACFSADTCAFEGEGATYVSSSEATPADLAERDGIFDAENPDNPLAEYSFVYVPYCTGDVHIGNATTEYSEDLTVHHNGYVNGLHALDHLVETFPETTELVVTGSSAGGIPAPLFAGLAADEFPDASIVSLSDSSGAYPDVPALNTTIGSLWGTTSAIPDWPETEGVTAEEWSIPGLYTYSGAHAPEVTFAKFDFAFDEVQAFFGGLAGVPADELVTLIDEIEADIEESGVDVASYVAPGTEHVILGRPEFYELIVAGERFVDWVTTLVEGEAPADVRCRRCA